MSGRLSSGVFVGRENELAELRAAYERAAGGTASTVLVSGEAGVGKTRLIAELASRAADAGALVLAGQCPDLREAAMPLLPIAEALRALGPLPTRASEGLEGAWRGVAPAVAVFAPVLELLREAAGSAPVLLAIDDVQWADRSTLDLLTFLIGRLRDERLLLVLAFRTDEIDRRAELREFFAQAGRDAGTRRSELNRLTRAEMGAQLEGILGRAPEAGLAGAVFARSVGNPLFTEELVAGAADAAGGGLPATLRDMLLARIRALSADAQAVVRVAAVAGRRVHHALMTEAALLEDAALRNAIREAVLDHVLVADGEALAFRHPLLQEVAYAEVLPGERAVLHAACADALERRPDLAGASAAIVAAEIAHHRWRAGDRPRALRAALNAGLEAERAHAAAEAAEHLGRALELWDAVPEWQRPPHADRVDVLARAAEATTQSGRPERAIDLATAALELTDAAREPTRAGLLHERRGVWLWWCGRGEDGLVDLEHAVRLIPAQPPTPDRARVLAGLGFMLMLTNRHARAREVCEEALEVARTVGARAAEVRALSTLGRSLFELGDRIAGIASQRRARALACELGEPNTLAQTAAALSDALWRVGRSEEALVVALEGVDDADRVGLSDAPGAALCSLNAAEAAFGLGRWNLVDEISTQVLAHPANEVLASFARYLQVALTTARGDFARTQEVLAHERERLGPGSGREGLAYLLEREAELALWQGRPEAASAAASQASELAASNTYSEFTVGAIALGIRAEADRAAEARVRRDVAALRAARDLARRFHDIARPMAGDHAAQLATIDAELARAERPDPAAWEHAAATWDVRGAPYPAAYARWRLAEALLARTGERAAAKQALRAARATAEQLGARPLLDEVQGLARRARLELAQPDQAPAPVVGPPDAAREIGLTRRELEVLEHVALGQTNREIAGDLFISDRTAAVHVSHILEKLGASTRTEAAAAAHRLGLVP